MMNKILSTVLFCCIIDSLYGIQITKIKTTIINPNLMDIWNQKQKFAISNTTHVEVINKKNTTFQRTIFSFEQPVKALKCLRNNGLIVASQNFINIFPNNSLQSRQNIYGQILQVIQDKQQVIHLIIALNSTSLLEKKLYNYVNFDRTSIFLQLAYGYVKVGYADDLLYILDEKGIINTYKDPFSTMKADKTINITKRAYTQLKTIDTKKAVLVYNNQGDFAFLKENKVIYQQNNTNYITGCICDDDKFILLNQMMEIVIFEDDKIVFKYKKLRIKDKIMQIQCLYHDDQYNLFILDRAGDITMIEYQENTEQSFELFIIIAVIVVLLIVGVIVKRKWYSKQQNSANDQHQDGQNQQRQLQNITPTPDIKKTLLT